MRYLCDHPADKIVAEENGVGGVRYRCDDCGAVAGHVDFTERLLHHRLGQQARNEMGA